MALIIALRKYYSTKYLQIAKKRKQKCKKKTQNTYGSLLDNKAVLKAVHQEQLKPLAENYPFFAKSLFSLSEWYGNWIRIRTENWNRFTCVIHAWIPWLNPRTVACKKNGKHIFFLHLYIFATVELVVLIFVSHTCHVMSVNTLMNL